MASPFTRLRRPTVVEAVVCLLALAALIVRFVRLDLAPFILDEPQFLAAARAQLQSGAWVSASPLVGTQGVHYGPSVLWLYGAVQALLGPRPETAILCICVLLSLAQLALAAALARGFGGGYLLFGLLLAFLASSPYHYFWSRLAWDPLVAICSAWAVALLAQPGPLGWRRGLALGAVLGFAVSSHLMVAPFVGLVLLLLGYEALRAPRAAALGFGACVAALLLVNVPYLNYVLHHHEAASAPPPGFDLGHLGAELLQPARVSGPWGFSYFLDGEWPRFQAAAGLPAAPAVMSAVLVLVLLGAGAGLAWTAVRGPWPRRRLALLGGALWLGYATFCTWRGLELHPHYQFPTYWVVPLGLAALVAAVGGVRSRAGAAIAVAIGAISLVQLAFIGQLLGYVSAHGGTRGIHYSVPVGHQRQAVQRLCAGDARLRLVENATAIFPYSLQYLSTTEPACAGKRLLVCPGYGCPPVPGALRERVQYAGADAWLSAGP